MLGRSAIEGLLRLTPKQLRAAVADLLPKNATPHTQIIAVELALQSPAGGALRYAVIGMVQAVAVLLSRRDDPRSAELTGELRDSGADDQCLSTRLAGGRPALSVRDAAYTAW